MATSGPVTEPDGCWVWLPHARVMLEIVGLTEDGALRLFHDISGRTCTVYDWREQIDKMQYVLLSDEEHAHFYYPEPLIRWDDC